jgi:hypothetical protein
VEEIHQRGLAKSIINYYLRWPAPYTGHCACFVPPPGFRGFRGWVTQEVKRNPALFIPAGTPSHVTLAWERLPFLSLPAHGPTKGISLFVAFAKHRALNPLGARHQIGTWSNSGCARRQDDFTELS